MSESQAMHVSLERLRLNAAKCRELANTAVTPTGREVLADMAEEYEDKAARLECWKRQHPSRSPFRWSLS